MNFDMNDMSITMTPLRAASCSACHCGNQFSRSNESFSIAAVFPRPAYQSGLSQPLMSPKYAPSAASRSWNGERFAPRAVSGCLFG